MESRGIRARRGVLLAALLRGAWRPSPSAPSLSDAELGAILPPLLRTGSGALGWRQVRQSPLRESAPARELQRAYRIHSVRTALHEREIEQLFTLLRLRGVEPLLVKGWVMARRYPEPGLRPYADIDLYVRPEGLARAEAALAEPHSRAAHVELHAAHNMPYDRGVDELFARSSLVRLGETEVRIPGEEDHLRLLSLHMLNHGAWRPLWLCDLALAVETRNPEFDWERCLAGNRRYSDWVLASLALAEQVLGGDMGNTPAAGLAKRLPRWVVPAVLRQWEAGAGACTHEPLAASAGSLLLRPAQLLDELRVHWRNPVQATVELGLPFNGLPRLPFQVAAVLRRLPDFVRSLRSRGVER